MEDDPASRFAVKACLSPVLLMLNSCMEEHRELTTEQWEHVRATYHHAEAVRGQGLAGFADQSHVAPSQPTGVVETTRARLPQSRISAEETDEDE
jgi:hypothetical protein